MGGDGAAGPGVPASGPQVEDVARFNLRNDGETPPQWDDREAREARARQLRLITRASVAIIGLVLAFVTLSAAKSIYTDWLWFDSLGYVGVYKTVLGIRIWLFFGGFLLVAALLLGNLYLAYRFARGESILPVPPDIFRLARIGVISGALLTVLIMSIVFGVVAQGRWETFLLYFNRVPFGVEDPQFHKDMSFHVAVMPMLHFIQGWFMGVVIAILVAVVALYFAIFAIRGIKFVLTPRIRAHMAILGAFLMVTIAAAHYLDIFELVFSGRGAAPGAGYTDVNARLPVLWLLVAIAMVSAAGFVASLYYGGVRMMIASFSLWAVLAVLAGGIYPVSFQRLRVNPSEFDREDKYVQRAIDATRAAYNLTLVDERIVEEYSPNVALQTIEDNPETIKNIPLWDRRPLRDVYNQIQAFELFYNFVGVDVDRYRFADGEYRQVMLAARELSPEALEPEAQNWVNRKLSFTHGYGMAMSPVTEYNEEGKPLFFLKDLPAVGRLEVEKPEIYYGENTKSFVIVNTDTAEFNFPDPEGSPVYQNYEGTGGVELGSFLRRVAYAWQLLDLNLLISGEISSDSRVQYRRQIQERVAEIAPFLRLDSDPYLVVGDTGKLWWIQDAYAVTDRYAYSARLMEDFNYIRNSVKVVIDANNGTVDFFVIEPDEPLTQIYRSAFPDLFKDFSEIDDLDPALRDHIRYPMDLFSAQAEIYLRYHMTNSRQFFEKGDLWARAREVFETAINTQDVDPYYVIMKLPGEEKEEFVLLLPFTPASEARQNMVAWMAARSDNDRGQYGQLVTLIFPTGQVDGPEQIENRITNDEDIGRELTLLCGEGKQCIRGNLLAIPMVREGLSGPLQSILYVEPLYIQAQTQTGRRLPELKKVIVADEHRVVMADTLTESLNLLLGTTSLVGPPTRGPGPSEGTPSPELERVRVEVGRIEDVVQGLRESLTELEESLATIDQALGGETE